MRQIQTVEGPFWSFSASYVGNVLAGGQFWDGHIKPSIDRAAAKRPGSWAIDLGANQGWFTLYLLKLFSEVVAVEAHPATYKVLYRNLQDRDLLGRAIVLNLAAYDSSCELRLAPAGVVGWQPPKDLDTEPNGDSVAFVPLPDDPQAGADTLLVRARPIDSFVHTKTDVGFIKCDCQGADLRALKGLRETIERCRPDIVFEFEGGIVHAFGDTWKGYLEFFREIGYQEPRRIYDQAWDWEVLPK